MYVRVPLTEDRDAVLGDFRELGIAQTVDEPVTRARLIHRSVLAEQQMQDDVPVRAARRCRLSRGAEVVHTQLGISGRVLAAEHDEFLTGEYLHYFVELGGEVLRIAECHLDAASVSQDPDPCAQLEDYEFHPGRWREKRDQLVESMAELQQATFGIEDLVGARIMLLAHQAEVIARVLSDRTCRYVLADEVGLGKTIEACVILKGLRRRNPKLRTLILAPATLVRQWQNELNRKFWLDYSIPNQSDGFGFDPNGPGIIISHELLADRPRLTEALLKRHWDVLVVDEAHNLHRNRQLFDRAHRLSSQIEHCLILSATPVQSRADEYLWLLKLMHPARYDRMTLMQFGKMLAAQNILRRTVAYLQRSMTPEDFDLAEFRDEIGIVIEALEDDTTLQALACELETESPTKAQLAASALLSYVSENYRIESRVVRNRRASLDIELPQRELDSRYAYQPSLEERETLGDLHDFAASFTRSGSNAAYIRILFHAAASSPNALLSVITRRLAVLTGRGDVETLNADVAAVLATAPASRDEVAWLEKLRRSAERWGDTSRTALDALSIHTKGPSRTADRLAQVLGATGEVWAKAGAKALIFCAWDPTYDLLWEHLLRRYGRRGIARFRRNLPDDELQADVDRFQSDDECRVLLTDESGGEGRNFQNADVIIHVDVPWTPAQIEQRIGRVDRLGRKGVVTSMVPYALGTLEHDLFSLWDQAFQLFTRSMSGMEIVLETIQDEISSAMIANTRDGLADLLDDMVERANHLREEVEEERYFEEGAIDRHRRGEFTNISERYRDGEILRDAILGWADFAGLHHRYDAEKQLVTFDPNLFNMKAITNARFVHPPDMREALRRSGRQRDLKIKGTFNRDVAVRREDLVFLAPGELWTDALIQNSLWADRGRCSAIERLAPDLAEGWEGFELLYRLSVDPRPLYAAGYLPVHLLRAQGYLTKATYRVVVAIDGTIIPASHAVVRCLRKPMNAHDKHLGRRGGSPSPLQLFKERYPREEWLAVVDRVMKAAGRHLDEEFAFTTELADEAREVFARHAAGYRAGRRWLTGTDVDPQIDAFDSVSDLIVQGIARPELRLESACYWWLKAEAVDGE
jgi:superfamily II DNA or RNA helicase